MDAFLIDALRKEGDEFEEVAFIGTESQEHRGSRRELDSGCEGLVVVYAKYGYSSRLPHSLHTLLASHLSWLRLWRAK